MDCAGARSTSLTGALNLTTLGHMYMRARGASERARTSRTALVVGLLALLSTASCAGGRHRVAHGGVAPGISVTGHGEAYGAPDIARVTIGIEVRAQVASDATEQANRQASAITGAITASGVAAQDIQTQNFSINFEQQPEPYPPRPAAGAAGAAGAAEEAPRGFYRVSNSLLVTVRDVSKLGAILGAATGAGANNIWGIAFEIEDPSKLEAQAREEAVREARARAEQLASLAGVKLGKVVSVSELGGGAGPMQGGAQFNMKAARADVPVQGGELTVNQDVQVLYSIE